MRLFLSSYKFGGHEQEFAGLFGDNKKVAVIMNALDGKDSARKTDSTAKQIAILKSVGLEGEHLDLREYFNKADALRKQMERFGGVWVYGGNAFVLRRAYEMSGFGIAMKEMLVADAIVYGAFSAGVVVITPTMKGAEIVDDPTFVPEGYARPYPENGIGIIDYVVAVHYQSDHPESPAVDNYIEYCKKERIPCRTLRDGEVIIVSRGHDQVLPIISTPA